MRAGTLRESVAVYRFVRQDDPAWGHLVGPGGGTVNVATFPANVRAAAGGEAVQDQGVQSFQRYTVTARFGADVQTTDHLKWNGRRLEILSAADPDSRRRELVIETVEHPGME